MTSWPRVRYTEGVGLLAILLGLLGALFPERLRRRLGLESNLPIALFTWIGGLVQMVGGAVLAYLIYAAHNGARGLVDTGVGLPGLELLDAWSGAAWAVVAWLLGEGALRTAAGLVGGACGTLPLWVVDRLLAGGAFGASRALQKRAVPDVVDRPRDGAITYRIFSCRDYAWTDLTTIEAQGEQYRVLAQRHDLPGERAHAYALGALTPGWVARGAVVRYDPRAVVRAEMQGSGSGEAVGEVARALVELAPPKAELIGGAAAVLLSPLVCMLPARTRRRLKLSGLWLAPFTMLTGLIEIAVGVLVWLTHVGQLDATALLGLLVAAEGVLRTVAGFAGIDCGLFVAWVIEKLFVRSAPLQPEG